MQKISKKIPPIEWYREKYPLSAELALLKKDFDRRIIENLYTKEKFVIVLGPCAADNIEAMTEYLSVIKQMYLDVSDKIMLVARVFTSKPRTDGQGYLGLSFHDKETDDIDFTKGIGKCRQLMINCIELGLPVADELLYPELSEYYTDLVSYNFIGARSSMDPLHRAVASGLDVAVGVKNSIDGDLPAMVKSVYAVQTPKTYLKDGQQIETTGNPNSHVVLRGFHDGKNFRKNCNEESVNRVLELAKQFDLKNDFVMVDCSHANSEKIAFNQIENALNVVDIKGVDGIILESYLYSGTEVDKYGVSKTDECLNLELTVKLIKDIYNKLK